jgi:hypothetical protein
VHGTGVYSGRGGSDALERFLDIKKKKIYYFADFVTQRPLSSRVIIS